MAIVNYTNPRDPEAYLLSVDEVCARVDRMVALGGTMVGFNGGFHPRLRLDDYAALFSEVRSRFPELAFYEMTLAEFMYACKVSQLSYPEGAAVLRSAGTRWVAGGSAEILDDGFRRRHSPLKSTVADFFGAQRAILEAGIGSTATMVIGFGESLERRLNHLERLRAFQDSVGRAMPSFLCWTYKPQNTALGGAEIRPEEYLRWLAVRRIYLDNFVHIRTSVLTQNANAMLGLQYGADDFDLPTEDRVTELAGATISTDSEEILAAARGLGFEPMARRPFRSQAAEIAGPGTPKTSASTARSWAPGVASADR